MGKVMKVIEPQGRDAVHMLANAVDLSVCVGIEVAIPDIKKALLKK